MATTKKTTNRKTSSKTASTKSVKQVSKKTNTVDYYPNRVPFLVAMLAAVLLLLMAYITTTPW